MNKIITIVGPTASGKTSLGIQIANEIGGEIINADSRQFYKELEIGTAKPTEEEKEQARFHLIDCASIEAPWNAAQFVEETEKAIQNCLDRNVKPIIVGGTGMYIRFLTQGIDNIPAIAPEIRKALKDELETNGIKPLWERLQTLDPEGAQSLEAGDTQRILRFLEVRIHTGKSIHSFWEDNHIEPKFQYQLFGLQWERETLYERINQRVLKMIDQGLEKEVNGLFANHPNNEILLKTIGYQEWNSNDETEEIINKIQQNTRRFAKRQMTWYRKEKDLIWIDASTSDTKDKILNTI